jgi:hypothetical protein
MSHPLSLSNPQLQLLLDAAARVPLDLRRRFLEAVTDRLMANEAVSDDAVQAAVSFVLNRMGVEAKPELRSTMEEVVRRAGGAT